MKNSIKQSRASRPRRRIVLLAAAIGMAIMAYSAIWYHSANRVEAGAGQLIAQAEGQGIRLDCSNREVWGYPFRIGLLCESVRYENVPNAFSFSAGEMRSAAQIYQPSLVVGELSGKGEFAMAGVEDIALDWEHMRASVRLADPLPERISLEAREMEGALLTTPLFTATNVQAHMRPSGADLDVAATIKALWLHMLLDEGLPAFDVFIDATIGKGVDWLRNPVGSLRGRNADLRHVHFDLGEEGKAVAMGSIAVRPDGLMDAEMTLQFEDARSLGRILANIFPESSEIIRAAADNLAFFGDNAEIPLRIETGRVFVGPFEIGALTPLP